MKPAARAHGAWLLGASALMWLTCAACSASPFRGGYAAWDASIPGAKSISSFVPGACQDTAHADIEPDFSSVELVQSSTGRPLLLERRQGHALLVAENFFDDGPFLVFEVLVKSEGLVRKWRIPRSPVATGTLQVGRQLTELRRGDGFEAGLASSRLSCSLVPKASDLPPSSTNRVP